MPPKKPGAKFGKVLVDPHTARNAKSNDPTTWGTLQEAITCAKENKLAGIGFVFTLEAGIVGIDLDHCRSLTTGEIADWAMDFIREFDSYTEISPSGSGVHILARGKRPPGARRKGKIEMYDSKRFFTVTGVRVPGTPAEIEERDNSIHRIHTRVLSLGLPWAPPHVFDDDYRAPPPPEPTDLPEPEDEELLEMARAAKNGAKFSQLWNGDHSAYPSESEADLALCGMLAFWVQGDTSEIDRLFRRSGLMREKWNEVRGEQTYGARTVAKALEGQSEVYTPRRSVQSAPKFSNERPAARAPAENDQPKLTDSGNAERFRSLFAENVRHCHPWKKWLIWDAKRWKEDKTGRVLLRTKDVIAQLYEYALSCRDLETQECIIKWALKSQMADRRKAMLELAKSEEGIPVLPDQLDRDPWLLNFKNGTLNLRTGELREHSRADYITRVIPQAYDPNAVCPVWTAFLERVLPDPEIRKFVQRAIGWSLTGDVSEQVLFFCYGFGANGKSTLLGVIQRILGRDYAMQAAPDLLLSTASRNHPTEIADLFGMRMVICMEVGEGRSFDEVLVKQLTGGDIVKARRMREDFWEFEPTHHLWIAGNHKPIVRGTDHAIWRRVLLVPFVVTIPKEERDGALSEKLLAEAPGILNWAVEGCRAWRKEGLSPPEAVRLATADYREEMDLIGLFLAERVISAPGCQVRAGEMYWAYKSWSEGRGERPLAQRTFGLRLSDKGFSRKKQGVEHYVDVQLATEKTAFSGSPRVFVDLGGPCGPSSRMNGLATLHEEVIAGSGPQGPHGPNRGADELVNGAGAGVSEPPPALSAPLAPGSEWGVLSW